MARAFRHGNFSVYVYAEQGGPHHLPHAHVKQGAMTIATVILPTLAVLHGTSLPPDLQARLRAELESLLELWTKLNESD